MASIFETLNGINVNDKTEKKKTGGTELTYLSWPWAWAEVKKRYPDAHYTIWKDDSGRPYAFDPLTGFMVYTSVTIGEERHDMWLPVMDGANNAMKAEPYDYTVKNPSFKWAKWDEKRGGYFDKYNNRQEEFITKHVDAATMFDVNKTIMRCLVKNLAMFGLGLYIYAGEDLPAGETNDKPYDQQPEPPMPVRGSTEAAQEAGKKKLEEIKAKQAAAAAGTSSAPNGAPSPEGKANGRRMATQEQLEYIRKNADDENYMKAMQAFGPELEKMTAAQANKMIERIQKAGAA